VVRNILVLTMAATVILVSACQADPQRGEPTLPVSHGETNVVLQPVLSLTVGDCLMDESTPIGADLLDIPLINCDLAHESEVYAEIVLDGTGFPGVDEIVNTAIASCMTEFATFVGIDHASSTLDFSYYYPTPSSWAVGDRSIFCVVGDPGVLTIGTLEGSRR
jgi:hypothetical protein